MPSSSNHKLSTQKNAGIIFMMMIKKLKIFSVGGKTGQYPKILWCFFRFNPLFCQSVPTNPTKVTKQLFLDVLQPVGCRGLLMPGQNRRQKVVNSGALRLGVGALRSCRGGLTFKCDKNSNNL